MWGVCVETNVFTKSYLSIRSQYVQMDEQNFSSLNITCGVPQGSIIGPLLFILYINDFNACTKDLKFIHFADDSTLYAKGNSLSDLAAKINTELHEVVKWLQINRVSLNVSKAFFTLFFSVSLANLPGPSIDGPNMVHSPTT